VGNYLKGLKKIYLSSLRPFGGRVKGEQEKMQEAGIMNSCNGLGGKELAWYKYTLNSILYESF
jgi:hypothetical protein